jgi:hypothetical protein
MNVYEEDNFTAFYLTQRDVNKLLLPPDWRRPVPAGWFYWTPGADLVGPFDDEREADLEAARDADDFAEAEAEVRER